MELITHPDGKKAIRCEFIEEARTFEPCQYITVEGDWYSVPEIAEREEGHYVVRLEAIERPEGVVAPDRSLFMTGDAELQG